MCPVSPCFISVFRSRAHTWAKNAEVSGYIQSSCCLKAVRYLLVEDEMTKAFVIISIALSLVLSLCFWQKLKVQGPSYGHLMAIHGVHGSNLCAVTKATAISHPHCDHCSWWCRSKAKQNDSRNSLFKWECLLLDVKSVVVQLYDWPHHSLGDHVKFLLLRRSHYHSPAWEA